MRTVVTGASGMLGYAIARKLKELEEDHQAWARSIPWGPGVSFKQVDLTETRCARERLKQYSPELVINCAALTDADFCEENPMLSWTVNAQVPEALAVIAKELGARFIQVSTDAVYDDVGPGRRNEKSRTKPKSVYAATKLEGEGRVLAAYPEALVVRTTMFGWTLKTAPRPKFAEQILAALHSRRTIPLFTDAYFSPLYVGTLARCLLELAALRPVSGVLNVGSRNPVNKWDFAWKLAETFGLSVNPGLLVKSSVDDVQLKAQRTKNVGLNVNDWERLRGRAPLVEEELLRLYASAFDGTALEIRERETYP